MDKKIEHRLYSIEKWEGLQRVFNKMLIMTPSEATWYALQGYEIFDYHESLDMEPEYYKGTHKHELL